jgi:hypothetical protein
MSSSNQRVVRINLCRMALSAFVELPYVLSMKSAATRAATEAPRRKGKTMLKLSDRLIRLWSEYRAEYQRVLAAKASYGRNSPAAVMRESIAKSVLDAYFDELEKHVEAWSKFVSRPRPQEGA